MPAAAAQRDDPPGRPAGGISALLSQSHNVAQAGGSRYRSWRLPSGASSTGATASQTSHIVPSWRSESATGVTLSDGELGGERAPSRRSACFRGWITTRRQPSISRESVPAAGGARSQSCPGCSSSGEPGAAWNADSDTFRPDKATSAGEASRMWHPCENRHRGVLRDAPGRAWLLSCNDPARGSPNGTGCGGQRPPAMRMMAPVV
jgi:hypothetical protein